MPKQFRPTEKAAKYLLMKRAKEAPCVDCGGVFDSVCMDFDHVPGRGEKKFNLYQFKNFSLAEVEDELSKCDLVCANCHRLRTKKRYADAKFGAFVNG